MTEAAEPIAQFTYTLTWQDALTYERLPREMSQMQTITFYLWLAIAGALLVALPEELVGAINTPRFWLTGAILVIMQYGIFFLARGIMRLNRARFRYPAPVEVVLSQWPDRLALVENGKPRTIGFDEIAVLLPAARHLFMAVPGDMVIVPATAFATPDGVAELAASIDAYMRDRRGEASPVDLPPPNA